MKKLTKMESFGLIAVILVGGSYFYLKKVYDPEAKALKKTVATLNKTIEAYNKLEEPPNTTAIKRKLGVQQEQLKEFTAELKAAGGRTGAASEVTEVLAEISRMAQRHHMQVVKIVPEKALNDNLFTWAVVSVHLQGQFPDFVALVRSLKEFARPVQLRRLQIERAKENNGDIVVKAQLLV